MKPLSTLYTGTPIMGWREIEVFDKYVSISDKVVDIYEIYGQIQEYVGCSKTDRYSKKVSSLYETMKNKIANCRTPQNDEFLRNFVTKIEFLSKLPSNNVSVKNSITKLHEETAKVWNKYNDFDKISHDGEVIANSFK